MHNPGRNESPDRDLKRVLTSWDATALIVGITIGSGIFATPPLIAGYLPGTAVMLLVWAFGGIMSLCGALCYAELASMFPRTGGSYVFLREAYGPFPAFAYGWSAFFVTYPASIAAVSVVFTAYLVRLLPFLENHRPATAALVCLLLAGINILGVRLGSFTLRAFTLAKVLALSAIFLAAFALWKGSPGNLLPLWSPPEGGWSAAPLALSLAAVLWTYEGWSDGPTLAGEVRDRRRDVVKALLLGTVGVTAIYLLTNLAYLFVLGIDGVRGSESVAGDVAGRLFGAAGSTFVTLLVLVSTLGSIMGMIVGGSRVFFALGRDGLFLRAVGRVDPRFGTPSIALAGLAVIAALYCLAGTFEEIIRYFVFISTFWFILNIGSVILHRLRRPDHERPFRVPFYPWPVAVYLAAAVALWIQLLAENTRDSLIGLGILAGSIPVYLVWMRVREKLDRER